VETSIVIESKFFQEFVRIADKGSNRGWHERNGGNMSYRIKPDEIAELKSQLNLSGEYCLIGTVVKELAGEFFLVTGSGKYFSNVKEDPESSLAIIQIDEKGEKYRICWGLKDGGIPTSELPTHLMNHQVKKRVSNGKNRIIYHGHTPNTIALTFVLPLEDRVFTRELWASMMECVVVFPEGVGVLPFMAAGGEKIAKNTAEKMEKYNIVIWAHHGTFCSGETFDDTFGLMETVEKSSEILVKVLSMANSKLNTMTTEDFIELGEVYNVNIPKVFL